MNFIFSQDQVLVQCDEVIDIFNMDEESYNKIAQNNIPAKF